MSGIKRAIDQGIHEGFEDALAGECDGYNEPQDRCPMRPSDGCACLRHRWRNLPWWRRIFAKEPMPTASGAALETLISQRIDVSTTIAELTGGSDGC